LHAGTQQERDVEQALTRLVERLGAPPLVGAGGAGDPRGRPGRARAGPRRGRRRELERAAELLRSLGPPVLAVPGNHDLPYTPSRFVHPWGEFERVWETTEPTASAEGLHVVGLNSARPFRPQGGALSRAQLERTAERLAAAAEGA